MNFNPQPGGAKAPTKEDLMATHKEQLNFRIDPATAQKLRDRAEREGRSLSNLIAWILTQAVKEG